MRRFYFYILFFIFIFAFKSQQVVASEDNSGRIYYGNVYGVITDLNSNVSLKNIFIFVTDQPILQVSENFPSAVFSNHGWIVVPECFTSVSSATSQMDGSYIVNNIPVNDNGSRYNVIIQADGWGPVIIDSALIFPGAVMALQVDVHIENTVNAHIVAAGQTSPLVVTNNFRHELIKSNVAMPESSSKDQALSAAASDPLMLRIYATREGLVGGTTANGHVITERDHFVALPSAQVLCSKDGYEYQVEMVNNGHSETAPVWDIGPWNIHDNYWNPDEKRTIYQYLKNGGQNGGLGQGLPESQAAYENDFNSGRDEFSRQVANPAGIDLADGTFWDGLNMSDNAWILVKYLWMESDGGEAASSGSCFICSADE